MSKPNELNWNASKPTIRLAANEWLSLVVVCLAQVAITVHYSLLCTAVGSIVGDLATPSTTVQMALVTYGMAVASLVVPGGKVGQAIGTHHGFRFGIILFACGLATVAGSRSPAMLIGGEGLAGVGSALVIPALIGLIATNYEGRRQTTAVATLSAAVGVGGSIGLVAGGWAITQWGWRAPFLVVAGVCFATLLLSTRVTGSRRPPRFDLDEIGGVLAAGGMLALVCGISQISTWGLLQARPSAPFTMGGLSPAPMLVLLGVLILQAFFVWQHRRARGGVTPLLSPLVTDTPSERSAILLLTTINILMTSVAFLIPLYTQLVQGFDALRTAWALSPFAIATFASATAASFLLRRFNPRQLGAVSFLVVAVGLVLLAASISDHWQAGGVIGGLFLVGTGVGLLASVLSTVIVSASPPELGPDVGALRGAANNLGGAMGPALSGALIATVLTVAAGAQLADQPHLSVTARGALDLDSQGFVSNDQLRKNLRKRAASDAEVEELVTINAAARLVALRAAILMLAGLSLVALYPCRNLPDECPTGRLPPDA